MATMVTIDITVILYRIGPETHFYMLISYWSITSVTI